METENSQPEMQGEKKNYSSPTQAGKIYGNGSDPNRDKNSSMKNSKDEEWL